jgi:hypothetical protein
MKPQERFAVFIKALGLWAMATGIGSLPLTTLHLRAFSDAEDLFYVLMGSVAEPILTFVCGWWLFRSNWLVSMTYPPSLVAESVPGQSVTQEINTLELFSAVLKLLGAWYVLQAVVRIPGLASYIHNLDQSAHSFLLVVSFEFYAPIAIAIIFGVLLLVATNWFIRLGFPVLVAHQENDIAAQFSQLTPQIALFQLAAKGLGVWCFVNGLGKFPQAIAQCSGGFSDFGAFLQMFPAIFGLPVMSVLVGCTLFFATDLFAKWAFAKQPITFDSE